MSYFLFEQNFNNKISFCKSYAYNHKKLTNFLNQCVITFPLHGLIGDIDLHPAMAIAYDGVEKIGTTTSDVRKNKPIIFIQRKGKA